MVSTSKYKHSKIALKQLYFCAIHHLGVVKYLLFLFSFSFLTLTFSQTFKIGVSADMKRRDFFLNIDAAFQKDDHQVGLIYGIGVQRAFLQAHHFPQFSASYGYRIVHKEQFQLFATNVFSYSTVKLGKTSHQRLHVFEEYIGFSYELGDKVRFKNAILGGLYGEKVTPKMDYFVRKLSVGYQFTIGVLYAF